MAGRKPRSERAAAPPRPSDSDDEAPEEFSKESAAQQAQAQRAREQQAQEAARAASKRKRQPRKEEKREEPELEELPDDVLSAVAAHHETDAAEAEAEEKRERQRERREQLKKQKTHVRQFGTVEARTLASAVAADASSRKLTPSAEQFLKRRTAPHRARSHLLQGHKSLFTKQQKQRSQEQQHEGVSA